MEGQDQKSYEEGFKALKKGDNRMKIPDANEIWVVYIKRKIAKHKSNKDNTPFTKREIRIMQAAFKAGFGWQNWYIKNKEQEVLDKQIEEMNKL